MTIGSLRRSLAQPFFIACGCLAFLVATGLSSTQAQVSPDCLNAGWPMPTAVAQPRGNSTPPPQAGSGSRRQQRYPSLNRLGCACHLRPLPDKNSALH